MGDVQNLGNGVYGVSTSATINGTVYVVTSTSPHQASVVVESKDQNNITDGLQSTKQRETCTFEFTLPSATAYVPQVNDLFTYQHDPTSGLKTWLITDRGQARALGQIVKITITAMDVTGLS